eukprot:6473564-Amphidinium_carterae.1
MQLKGSVVVPSSKKSRGAIDHLGATCDQLWDSRRRHRDQAERLCIGGLLRPWVSLLKVPGWRALGVRIRRVPNQVIGDKQVHVVKLLGTADATEVDEELIAELRSSIAEEFDTEVKSSGLQAGLIGGFAAAASDPDVHNAAWAFVCTAWH